jgi:hypothetical protein
MYTYTKIADVTEPMLNWPDLETRLLAERIVAYEIFKLSESQKKVAKI